MAKEIIISEENLNKAEAYARFVHTPEFRQQRDPNELTAEEDDVLVPIVSYLFWFGASVETDSNKKKAWTHYSKEALSNKFGGRQYYVDHTDTILELIERYRGHVAAKELDRLFKMKLIDMNGYEFKRYLTEIGLI